MNSVKTLKKKHINIQMLTLTEIFLSEYIKSPISEGIMKFKLKNRHVPLLFGRTRPKSGKIPRKMLYKED